MPNYPGALDSLANPSGSTQQDDPTLLHSAQHGTLNDIVEAIETKLGIGASVAAANQVLRGTGAGASAFGQVANGDLAGNITLAKLAAITANHVVRADGAGVIAGGLLAAANVAAGALPVQLATATLGAAATVNLTIAGGYQHLLLVLHGRSAGAIAVDGVALRFNGDSAGNYFGQQMVGAGSTANAAELSPGSSEAIIGYVPGASAPSGSYFNGLVAVIPGYANTTTYKTVVSVSHVMYAASTGNFQIRVHGMTWAAGTAAITSMLLFAKTSPTTLAAGTIVTVYGLN